MAEAMDFITPQNLFAAYSGGRKAYAYVNEFKRKTAYGKRKPSSYAAKFVGFKRPISGDRYNQFGNGVRKNYADKLSLTKLKDALCPRWNLKTDVSTKSFATKPGRQQILEHEYMDSVTINDYIQKSSDVIGGTTIFRDPLIYNVPDGLSTALNLSDSRNATGHVTSVKCCMMSYTVTEEFHNSSEINMIMNLYEVTPRIPHAHDFIQCWKNALLERAPSTQSKAIVIHNAILNVNDSNAASNVHAAAQTLTANHLSLTNSGEVTGKSVEDYLIVPGARPNFSALAISMFWRLKRFKRVVIKPGETYMHSMSFKPFCIDQAFFESIAKVNPFRTRKLIVCAYGEKVSVDDADFSTSGSGEINRRMRVFGQFRAMPYQKRRTDIVMGSGGVDVYTLPCYKTAALQDQANPSQLVADDTTAMREDGVNTDGITADGENA